MKSDLDAAHALQAELTALASDLARHLDTPHKIRDIAALREAWQRIDRNRSRMTALGRAMRKQKRRPRVAVSRTEYDLQRTHAKAAKALQQHLKLWPRIEDLVTQHMDPVATPIALFRDPSASDPMLVMLHKALHRLANPNAQSDAAEDFGCFSDIALNIQAFESLMLAAYRLLAAQGRADTARFLDVGCGGGTKVFAASRFFSRCDGLDFDPIYVKAAKRTLNLLNADECHIFEADGMTFEGYDAYDVIYFYRPLRDDAMLARLEQQILNSARLGTVILAPYDLYLASRPELNAARITGPVFIAGISQAQADTLRSEAEYTSPDLLRRARHQASDPGFWTPILDATRFNPRS